MKTIGSNGAERVTAAWLIAGLCLVVLVGLSLSIELPGDRTIAEADTVPVAAVEPVATEDMYDPDEANVLALQEHYADLVTPASYEDDEIRTGVAP